jgi:hypothetical protein
MGNFLKSFCGKSFQQVKGSKHRNCESLHIEHMYLCDTYLNL